jgi:hypothetical protein
MTATMAAQKQMRTKAIVPSTRVPTTRVLATGRMWHATMTKVKAKVMDAAAIVQVTSAPERPELFFWRAGKERGATVAGEAKRGGDGT